MSNLLKDILEKNKIDYVETGWRPFKINWVKTKQTNNYGEVFFDTGIINISMDVDYETTRETLLHEIMHVCCEFVGLGDNGDSSKEITVTNEDMVLSLTRGLLSFAYLNPDLWEILFLRKEDIGDNYKEE